MTVPRHEAEVVRLQRFLVGRLPPSQVAAIVHQTRSPQPMISRSAATLVEDALRKGIVLFLMRHGGWQLNARPAMEWRFSPLPLRFLLWLTATRPSEARNLWPASAPTLADQVAFFLAAQSLPAFPEEWRILAATHPFAENPLVWLSQPMEGPPPTFEPCLKESLVLECLQPWLAERWAQLDRDAGETSDAVTMIARGTSVSRTLGLFLTECETHGRQDLAAFLLTAMRARLKECRTAVDWSPRLTSDASVRLADRIAARTAALSMMAQIETLARWDRDARRLAFFDDGYENAQRWKTTYEAANGAEMFATWLRLKQELEPI